MTADTDPRCPLCGAMLQPMVEHRCSKWQEALEKARAYRDEHGDPIDNLIRFFDELTEAGEMKTKKWPTNEARTHCGDPRCPVCNSHTTAADRGDYGPLVRAVFSDGTTLEPQPPGAGVFELRELLSELVAILHRPNKFCEGCGRWQGSWHDASTGNQGISDNHAPGCPVDRARRAVT